MRILLDLDCVLADFVKGACQLHGLTVEETLPHWRIGTYSMPEAVGRALGRERYTLADYWKPLNGNRAFWADLEPLPWARELVDRVRNLTDDWWIVTSPSLCDFCVPGKRDWCNRFFGVPYFERLIPLSNKYLLANPHTILIDDYDRNVEQFTRPPYPHSVTPGHGIILPAYHNSRHEYRTDPLTVVLKTLERKLPLCT